MLQVAAAALKGLRGLCLLELVYSLEAQVLRSSKYFKDEAAMWRGSMGMVLINGCTLAFIMKTHKYGKGHTHAAAAAAAKAATAAEAAVAPKQHQQQLLELSVVSLLPFLLLRLKGAVDEGFDD
ncbi:hypothetical protein, conserved [Eimeria tenella]|uniref:Uncharacterized protein n=1 Tax=Eimeria tenella TaxID=5802 RepID=U6LAE9_EIMTE|nr:hypothetical protein, conserved [Eimeria tenella]CDJ45514.1 hypothetical protein, conserved [Eimeria tenella]|eukprot:XP_013236260.1 hypothetical protein, conserved [Eimeria tenella]